MPKSQKKRSLIKKGAPLPGKPSYKYDSSYLKEDKAEDRAGDMLDNPKVKSVRIINIPKQHAVYASRSKPKITPKRRRISK